MTLFAVFAPFTLFDRLSLAPAVGNFLDVYFFTANMLFDASPSVSPPPSAFTLSSRTCFTPSLHSRVDMRPRALSPALPPTDSDLLSAHAAPASPDHKLLRAAAAWATSRLAACETRNLGSTPSCTVGRAPPSNNFQSPSLPSAGMRHPLVRGCCAKLRRCASSPAATARASSPGIKKDGIIQPSHGPTCKSIKECISMVFST